MYDILSSKFYFLISCLNLVIKQLFSILNLLLQS